MSRRLSPQEREAARVAEDLVVMERRADVCKNCVDRIPFGGGGRQEHRRLIYGGGAEITSCAGAVREAEEPKP